MKAKNTFGAHFVLRPNKNEDGKSSIYARMVINGTRTEISIKAYVLPGDWNSSRGAAKPRNEELKILNNYLEDVRGKLFTHYRDLKIDEAVLTAEAVKNSYLGIRAGEEPQQTLCWLVREHNIMMAKVLKHGSLKNYYTTERYIQKFLGSKYPSGDIFLSQLRYEFITGFEHYVRTHALKVNDPCTNNGTMKHLERLRKMVTWAVKNEWVDIDPFANFKLHFKRTERDFLTEQELGLIANVQLSVPILQKVHDLFLFSCYTGLSFIDLVQLKPHQVVTVINGIKWIATTRAKTSTAVNIPLLEPAVKIMEKFKDDQSAMINETVFPKISNQEMNRSLKIIAGLCGIKKGLTFHMARHTFATTVTLMNGVPIESISKMLGHTKLSTTMIYARVSQNKIGMDMMLLQEKMNTKK
jgi:site-specific recombinase XerD